MVLTDETNAVFLRDLKAGLQKWWSHVGLLGADIKRRLPKTANNYHVYAVASTIIGSAAFQMGTPKWKCPGPLKCLQFKECHPCGHSPPTMGPATLFAATPTKVPHAAVQHVRLSAPTNATSTTTSTIPLPHKI